MARMSLEYWASPASDEFTQNCDRYREAGRQAALNGQRPDVSRIFGTYRMFYFLGFNEAVPVAA